MGAREINSEDFFSLKLVRDPQISPDGSQVAYVQMTMDSKTNKYHSGIWIVANKPGAKPRLFTSEEYQDYAPRWSPDGKWLLFLSNRNGNTNVYVIPSTGGKEQKIAGDLQIEGYPVWSPDSQKIALIIRVGKDGLQDRESKLKKSPRERFTEDVLVIDRLLYKLDSYGFLVKKRCHLFVLSVFGPEKGNLRQMTFGEHDYFMPAWSPDGKYIAIVGNRVTEKKEPSIINELWMIPIKDEEQKKLILRRKGPISYPAWSPDGRLISYVGHIRQQGSYTFPGIWLVDISNRETFELTSGLNLPVGDHSLDDLREHGSPGIRPVWSPDGQSIFMTVSSAGAVHLWRFSVPDGISIQLTSGRYVIYNISLSQDVRYAAAAVTNATLPGDIWVLDLKDEKCLGHRLTNVNREWLEQLMITKPTRFTYQSFDETEIEGWIMYPPEPSKQNSVPAVLEIHGGPMAMYGYTFFFEFQLLSSHGFVVIYTNPRGSFGYSQEFSASIRGDWGNLDYKDLMAAVDTVLKQETINPNRLGVAGGSYGGYMTNWIVTQTDRFKAAVTMRSISNVYSFFGTSDGGYMQAKNYGGPPWRLPGKYLKQSPISYVENVQTPLLMIHSDDDFRTPIEQGEQFYTALKFLNRQVKMVRFLNETHELSRSGEPWHRVVRLDYILNWFKAYLK